MIMPLLGIVPPESVQYSMLDENTASQVIYIWYNTVDTSLIQAEKGLTRFKQAVKSLPAGTIHETT